MTTSEHQTSRQALELFQKIDAICLSFEKQWQEGKNPSIEMLMSQIEERGRSELLKELLPVEWEYRKDRKESLEIRQYLHRFPHQTEAIEFSWHRWNDSNLSQDSSQCRTTSFDDSIPAPLPIHRMRNNYGSLEKIGQGGMGVVYKGFDPRLKRIVAIKTIHAGSCDRLARFQREAEILARLHHPHIVQIHAWEEVDGHPALILEYAPLGSLENRIQNRSLSVRNALNLLVLIARAIQAAHAVGVIHRDLKPANILLAAAVPGNPGTIDDFFPKITDFGLAHLVDEHHSMSGEVIGTPLYMAPEQAEGRLDDISAATDVWAMGVILYRLLSGQVPFQGKTVLETLELIKTTKPPKLSTLFPTISPELEDACLACLNRDPDKRPSAEQFAISLEQYLTRTDLNTQSLTPVPPKQFTPHASRLLKISMGLVGAALFTIIVVYGMQSGWFMNLTKEGNNQEVKVDITQPLKCTNFTINYYPHSVTNPSERKIIGLTSMTTRFKDSITFDISFNQATSFYLVGLNPDGNQQLLWPATDKAPEPRQSLTFPPSGDWWNLNDEPRGGTQAFVLIATKKTLPSFTKWIQQQKPPVWNRFPPQEGVWFADAEGLFPILQNKGVTRGGIIPPKGAPPLKEVRRHYLREGIDLVEVMAFPVFPQ